jgi:hypothetical protein
LGKILNSPQESLFLGKFVKHQKIDSCFWENPSNTKNKTLLLGKFHKPKKALISPKTAPKIKLKLGEKCKNWGLLFAVWYHHIPIHILECHID